MKLSAAILLTATAAAGLVVAGLYDVAGGVETAALMGTVGALALTLAHIAARRRQRLPLRRQFVIAVLIAVGTILTATIAGALLMFVSGHDAVMIAVITVLAGVLATRAAALFSEGMVGRLRAEEERAAAADRARRDLVAGASHDLRTPVAALSLLVEALQDELADDDTQRRYRATMRTHVRALSGLIDDLFELTRLQAGEISWSLRQVSVGELLDETVQALSAPAQAKGVRLGAERPPLDLMARADPEKVQRVLFNLVQNAIRHTPADGSVTIRASAVSEHAEIEITDTGDGIAAEQRTRVFEPFYRAGADASRSREGAGLGLAISRAIVEGHGGRIWIEPAPVGTRIRFTLPCATAQVG